MMTLWLFMGLTALLIRGRMIMFALILIIGHGRKVLLGIVTILICVLLWPVVLFGSDE